MQTNLFKTILLTALALIAFAANSVLCRLALGEGLIDAGSFTAIRLLSGALILFLLINLQHKPSEEDSKGSWSASVMLFIYAVAFSYAYMSLDTGTGALILFGAVQVTMITMALYSGHKLTILEVLGLLLAFLGFVYLMLPGASAPSLFGFILMMFSGIAWGFYTLKGSGSSFPLLDTAYNFIRTIPMVLILLLLSFNHSSYSFDGVVFAVLSGAVASGVGYTIWYMALRGLTSIHAAVLQLFVPVIAAFGGVLFVSEVITDQLMISSAMILGGILLVILKRNKVK
ncbi:MAG: DMT family transporter [Ghiorsea sp.]